MFYCDPCAKKRAWPRTNSIAKSVGTCEMCKELAPCNDVPARYLPASKHATVAQQGEATLSEICDDRR